jgi:hypothetical protein
MQAIWQKRSQGWATVAPVDVTDEKSLHDLIEEAPQMLPLSGMPSLVVLGREVQLGTGYADLIASEASGRLAIIEVKLARNSEARRAVVAQILAYAAVLNGSTLARLQDDILASHLRQRRYQSIAHAVETVVQDSSFDHTAFEAALASTVADGQFRLVFVLDKIPDDLVRLVGYLESITNKVVIDLIQVSGYDIEGTSIWVPRRVAPERVPARESSVEPRVPRTPDAPSLEGPQAFAASIETAAPEHRNGLNRLLSWAQSLESQGLVRLVSTQGQNRTLLRPVLKRDGVGFVTIWNERGPYISLWRNVFERRAPKALQQLETAIAPMKVGQGNTLRDVTEDVLRIIESAYREASGVA